MKFGIKKQIGNMLRESNFYKKRFFRRNHECILIACMPKSGSTYLLNVLLELTGFQYFWLSYGTGRTEQNLYPPSINRAYRKKSICQLHCKATEDNLKLIKENSIKPIVLVRNIFDIVTSIQDHMYNESTKGPIYYADRSILNLEDSLQKDFIVRLAIPWYIYFYVSWFYASKKGIVEPIWIKFEEMKEDPVYLVSKIAKYINVKVKCGEIETAIKKIDLKKVRFNKGIIGRGRLNLSKEQIETIKSFTKFYPDVDFGRIGM